MGEYKSVFPITTSWIYASSSSSSSYTLSSGECGMVYRFQKAIKTNRNYSEVMHRYTFSLQWWPLHQSMMQILNMPLNQIWMPTIMEMGKYTQQWYSLCSTVCSTDFVCKHGQRIHDKPIFAGRYPLNVHWSEERDNVQVVLSSRRWYRRGSSKQQFGNINQRFGVK